MQHKPFTIIAVLLGLFAVSVALRLPFLQQSANGSLGWQSAHTLLTIDIWNKAGLAANHFSPAVTYPGEANTEISNWIEAADSQGHYYYISYPPFAFILPYAVFNILHTEVSLLGLQLLGMLVQLIAALGIFTIIRLLYPSNTRFAWSAAIVGYAFYLFAPGSLWFHAEYFVFDTVVQPLWIWTTYLVIRLLHSADAPNTKQLLLLALLNALFAYTEWVSALFGLSVVVLALLSSHSHTRSIPIILTLLVSGSAAIALTLLQYSLIDGPGTVIGLWIEKFAIRSGESAELSTWGMDVHSSISYFSLAYSYLIAHLPLLLAVPVLGLIVARMRGASALRLITRERDLLLLALLPLLLHHALLFNWTAVHIFSSLKAAFPLSVLLAMFFYRLEQGMNQRRAAYVVAGACILACCIQYVIIVEGQAEPRDLKLAQTMGDEASVDETVFIQGEHTVFWGGPQLLYYSGRNPKFVSGRSEALTFMETHHRNKGILFTVSQKKEIVGTEHLTR